MPSTPAEGSGGAAEAPEPKRGLLATRGRKIAAIVGGAFLAGIGGGIAAWVVSAAKDTTSDLFSGGPVEVRVARAGTFFSEHAFAPYYVVPDARVPGPDGLTKADLKQAFNSETFMETWARDHGGVPGSPGIVRLEIRGRGDEPVAITAVRARVVRRSSPVRGWYVLSGGCGGQEVRVAAVDLDASPPRVRYFQGGGSERSRLSALRVTRTDLELVQLQASTREGSAEWEAEVFYSAADGEGSVVVDDAGRPFHVTAETASEGYELSANSAGEPRLRRQPAWDDGIEAC
jgi:hypothetical protein